MGPATVEHSGRRHVGGRHVGRWAVVRGGVRHAARPRERLLHGCPTLPQVSVAAPAGPVILVQRLGCCKERGAVSTPSAAFLSYRKPVG